MNEHSSPGSSHSIDDSVQLRVLLVLFALTALTVVSAKAVHFGAFNIAAVIGIASLKAALVMMYFMHLKLERPLIITIAVYPVFIFALLFGGSYYDVVTRGEGVSPASLSIQAPGAAARPEEKKKEEGDDTVGQRR